MAEPKKQRPPEEQDTYMGREREKERKGGSDVKRGKAVTEEGLTRVDHREDHQLTQGRFSFSKTKMQKEKKNEKNTTRPFIFFLKKIRNKINFSSECNF